MTETTLTRSAEIAAFAVAVRAELDDLPGDEVDDLLDGFEADLAEQAAETGDDFALPDAAAYAAELRAAAGLPERIEGPAPRMGLRERLEVSRRSMTTRIRSSRGGAATLDFLVSLRPVWWIARGAAFYLLLVLLTVPILGSAEYVPTSIVSVVVLAALVVLSVQWGRGRWLPARWVRGLRSGLNVVAGVVVAVALISAPTVLPRYFSAQDAMAYAYVDNSQPGLVLDGQRVRNIFVYDSAGQPLEGVQLFTEQGEPLATVGREGLANGWRWDEYFLGGGGPVTGAYEGSGLMPLWNVFPLREAQDVIPYGESDTTDIQTARPPFTAVPAVPASTGADADSPEPTASPAPTPVPEPSPTAEVVP